jgi:hypothetical protein
MTDAIHALWQVALQEIVDRSAHEVKDSLNGVSLNLEVIRSRSTREGVAGKDLKDFAEAASGQFETLTGRVEALLALGRSPRAATKGADVAVILKQLATLLVPAAKADGRVLQVKGDERGVPTAAPALAVRLAIAVGLLTLVKGEKGGRCLLEGGAEPVVRFSHESAVTCSLDSAVADALADSNIRHRRSGHDLLIVFPGP